MHRHTSYIQLRKDPVEGGAGAACNGEDDPPIVLEPGHLVVCVVCVVGVLGAGSVTSVEQVTPLVGWLRIRIHLFWGRPGVVGLGLGGGGGSNGGGALSFRRGHAVLRQGSTAGAGRVDCGHCGGPRDLAAVWWGSWGQSALTEHTASW